jgi:tetratricopeptide (TPR) repeat protein
MVSSGSGSTDETVVSDTDHGMDGGESLGRPLDRGDTVGRYVVLERVGIGGMGMVYAAYDPELDRKIALKLVRPGGRGDPSVARTRLMREAQAMARVTHANVITVHDVGDFEGQIFVAMEFIEGRTLKQWQDATHPSWREVVDVYTKAAAGLSAAHEAELVHRDFKPDNVMIGDDGRVVVMDFGLARAALPDEDRREPVPPSLAMRDRVGSSGDLSTTVTRDGAIVGTPAYMAPEQHLGLDTDPRTDQFSFGIALYESLYDQHPFGGNTLAALADAVADGEVRAPPRGSDVPPWVRRVVMRALSVKAVDRYPSMSALITDLGRDPAASRNRVLGVVGVLGLAGAAAFVAYNSRPEAAPDTCQGAAAHVAEVWTPERAKQIEEAFAATAVSFAADGSRRVRELLDARFETWAAQHTAACEAGLSKENSEHVLDLRMACLQRDLTDVRELLSVFEEADASVVTKAADAVAELPDPARCGDVDALLANEHEPPGPARAQEVEQLQAEIPRVHALYRAGKPKQAHELAEPLVDRAEATQYGPVIAEALNLQGHLQIELGQYADAEATLERALLTAIANRSQVGADAGTRLTWVTGMALQRHEDGLRWGRLVKAELERAGGANPLIEIRLLKNTGEIHHHAGDLEQARSQVEKALEQARRHFPPDHPAIVGTMSALGGILTEQGEFVRGQEILREALRIREKSVGAAHPSLGILLNNLGAVAEKRGELDEAVSYLRRAHELKLATYGPSHPSVGFSENNLSATYVRLGRHEEAIQHGRRAIEIWNGSIGAEHPAHAYALANIGRAQLGLQRVEEATKSLEKALEIGEKAELSRDVMGEIRFGLGRALQDTDPPRANALVGEAKSDYESLGDQAPAELAEVEAWLARHAR